jgi:hypothetical protein
MKVKVIGHVPTVYQMKSLSDLAGEYKKWPDGSFGFEREFNTVREAKEFLADRAFTLLENGMFTNGEFRAAMYEIKHEGYLRYDAATLTIEK